MSVVLILNIALSFMTLADVNDADELYNRINLQSYREFARPSGFENRTQSDAEIQHFFKQPLTVDIYINKIIDEALTKDSINEWPPGSLLVKDAFLDNKLELTSVMEKRENGWFYAEWNARGVAKAAGYSVPDCIRCHASGDDMLQSIHFPQNYKK